MGPERGVGGQVANPKIIIFLSFELIFHLLTHSFIHFLFSIPAQALEAQIYKTSSGLWGTQHRGPSGGRKGKRDAMGISQGTRAWGPWGWSDWLGLGEQWKTRVGSVQFSRSVVSDSLRSHESQHARPPHPSPTPRVYSNSYLVGDAIQPSHPLSSPSPPAPNLSQHQGLFQWVNSLHEVAKVLELQLQRQSFQWTPRADLLQDGLGGGRQDARRGERKVCSKQKEQQSLRPRGKTVSWERLMELGFGREGEETQEGGWPEPANHQAL